MRVLLGVVISGPWKEYAVKKFEQQAREVFCDVDVLAVVDARGRTTLPYVVDERMRGSIWATEICAYGKETLATVALEGGYDTLIWQGVDCFYDTREDFERLLQDASRHDIVGALVAGRNRENYAVCHPFIERNGVLLPKMDHPRGVRPDSGKWPYRGYIGSDATALSRTVLETITMDGYEPWHVRQRTHPEEGYAHDHLGPEPWFMYRGLVDHGIVPVIDTNIRPWHAHETLRTVRYKGEVCHLYGLGWAKSASSSSGGLRASG